LTNHKTVPGNGKGAITKSSKDEFNVSIPFACLAQSRSVRRSSASRSEVNRRGCEVRLRHGTISGAPVSKAEGQKSDLSKLGFKQKGTNWDYSSRTRAFNRRSLQQPLDAPESTALTFVLPSVLEGSAVRSTDHQCTGKAPTQPMSSRPERSEWSGSAVKSLINFSGPETCDLI
jgi:hypothetical protein